MGMTQGELAVKLGKDRELINQYVNGKVNIPFTALEEIAWALRIPLPLLTTDRDLHDFEIAFYDGSLSEQDRQTAMDAAMGTIEAIRRRRSDRSNGET